MNERIQKLAEQARKYADENRPGSFVKYDPEWFVLYNKKFAELIVQQCGVALSPMLRDMVSRGQSFDLIKEHFGVEE